MRLAGRIFLFIAAGLFVWWAFFKKPTAAVINQGINPVTGTRVGTSADVTATTRAVQAQVIASAGSAAAQGAGQLTGIISDGIASSLTNLFSGAGGTGNSAQGSYSSATPTDSVNAFVNLGSSTTYPDDSGAIDSTI